jgi:adenosylcobinamide-GDP ribazoletransferase
VTLPPYVRGARAAVTFLTRVPVGGWPYTADDFRWASGHFPLVGAAIGAALGAVFTLALPLGPLVAAGLALAFGLLLTGGFHEDGLADTADALGGGYDASRVLEILKDSRIGAFGGLALSTSLLIRAALLAALAAAAPVALVVAHAVSRATPVALMVLMPYATDDAHSRSRQIVRAGPAQVALAAAWAAAILAAAVAWTPVTPRAALTAAGVAIAITAVAGWRFHRRVGGITGDFCGATQQLCETGVLISLLAVTS